MRRDEQLRQGRPMKTWLGSIVAVLLAIAGGGWHLSAQVTDTQRRVDTVEKRQTEDRETIRRDVRETNQEVKEVKSELQQIRILLEGMKRERSIR
jgi:uncharacterized membrane protein